MSVLHLRKNRIIKLAGGFALVVLILILVSGGSKSHGSLQNGLGNEAKVHVKPREPPVFLHGQTGNFEPDPWPEKEGPGEGGKAYNLPSSQQNEGHQSVNEYGINMVVSDAIAMDRTIPDTRLEECKYWDYPDDLPKASVVVVFHNEGWSTLLRTVHTVIDRSPPQFLEEVLLVDDFSDKANLKRPLDDYIRRFHGKVRLVRNKEREGLIRSRTNGAREARGEVVLFLDAHCEVGRNWLPPLLAPIYVDRTTMSVPIIDGIDHDDFTYRPVYGGDTHFRGIFEWGMLYKETEVPAREKKKRKQESEPYASPTHAGGLFAIDRKYFLELGAYDPGLLVWGGENFELSFKIWQCGGKIVWVPCSRVGHVYRGFMPYTFGKLAEKKKGPLITINYKRVIEVWFDDDFKEYFYTREPMARFLDAGNLTEQLELKRRLHCKSFKWFMENVAYDVPDKYPYLPPNSHWGELRNVASGECLDTMGHGPPALMGISYCHGFGNNQLMRLNTEGQLMVGERCVIADSQGVKLVVCRLGTVDGPWQYDEQSHTMYHRTMKKCMSVHAVTKKLTMLPCSDGDNYFKWVFKPLEPKW